MSREPLVSIVTPSLNRGNVIGEAIASVLDQDYPRIEYLVMDGGSSDCTLDVLRAHGDRLRWVSAPDAGQSAAINAGWRAASGEILAWLNTDDTYLPGAVRHVVEFFAAHPEVDAVFGDCDYVDADGRHPRPYPTRPYDYLELVRTTINYLPQPATFVRRRALASVGYLDETLHYVMDLDYWLRLGMRHTVAHLPVRLATLRLHAGAKSVQDVAGFGPELVAVYQTLFARPDLPGRLRVLEGEAMSNAYYRAAHGAFWAGRLSDARSYAWHAWRRAPRQLRPVLLLALGWGPARAVAGRVRLNPYLLPAVS
jgi:glycosyltransferase involved in cell wall biosynthesis